MRKKTVRAPRDSALASGWTVEGEAAAAADPTLEPPVNEAAEAEILASEADGSAADGSATDGEVVAEGRTQVSNGALVSLGVFGGVYLLYTVGWFIVAQAYSAVNALTAAGSGSLGGILQQVVFWAAPFAPALWFCTAFALSRGNRTARLAILLAIGAVVLLPLPMLITRGG